MGRRLARRPRRERHIQAVGRPCQIEPLDADVPLALEPRASAGPIVRARVTTLAATSAPRTTVAQRIGSWGHGGKGQGNPPPQGRPGIRHCCRSARSCRAVTTPTATPTNGASVTVTHQGTRVVFMLHRRAGPRLRSPSVRTKRRVPALPPLRRVGPPPWSWNPQQRQDNAQQHQDEAEYDDEASKRVDCPSFVTELEELDRQQQDSKANGGASWGSEKREGADVEILGHESREPRSRELRLLHMSRLTPPSRRCGSGYVGLFATQEGSCANRLRGQRW